MTPLEMVQDVVAVAQAIYNQVKLVENNKKRWSNLVHVIQQISSALEGLKQLPRQKNFEMSLARLQSEMHAIADFLNQMCNMPYWKRFAFAGKHQATLDSYRQALFELLPLLQLGLSAQNLVDRDEDRQAELADREDFIRQKEKELEKRQAEHLKEKHELEVVMQKQMQAFCEQLEKNWQVHAVTPPSEKQPLPESFIVKLYEVTFEKKLMASRTGDIYRATWKDQPVLVKFIEGVIIESDQQQFIREAQIMSQLHNEHLVPFYGACFEKNRMCIITGRVEKSLIMMLSELTWEERYLMARDLAEGLFYLHGQGVIHNDIHPKNIGVTKRHEGKWLDLSWVKTELSSIASLGIAHETTLWQAPEIWRHRARVSPESDIYSFGWLLWTLYTGQLPFLHQGGREFLKQIQQGLREPIPSDCPRHYATLIQACWENDPRKRACLRDILSTLNQPLPMPRAISPTGEEYYEQGKKAEQAGDLDTAFENYTRSANKKYYKSFNSLGTFALTGKAHQPKDFKKAEKYFQLGARAEHPPAMFNLARMYEKGDTENKIIDLNKALFWYEKARDVDNAETRYQEKVEMITQRLRLSGSGK